MSRLFAQDSTDKVIVTAAASINNLAQRTILGWMKFSLGSASTDYCLSSRSASTFTFGVNPTAAYGAYCSIDAATDAYSEQVNAASPVAETWSHFAITYDNAGDRKIDLFINGVEVSYVAQQAAVGALVSDAAINLVVGSYTANPTPTPAKKLFDFRVYNSILTPANLADIIALGSTEDPAPANLVCQLTFETDQGATEPDASGNGNNGAITGAAFNADNPSFGATVYSVPDCRDYATFPNDFRDVQDTLIYDVPAFESRTAGPTVDSRAAGPVIDSRVDPNIPYNSRTFPPF